MYLCMYKYSLYIKYSTRIIVHERHNAFLKNFRKLLLNKWSINVINVMVCYFFFRFSFCIVNKDLKKKLYRLLCPIACRSVIKKCVRSIYVQ